MKALLSLLVSSMALAQTPTFSNELGFKTLESKGTPEIVHVAAKSTFEIILPSSESLEKMEVVDLSLRSPQEIEATVDGMTDLSVNFRKVVKAQIQNCRDTNKIKNCALHFSRERATGFIAGKNKIFWVNAHAIKHQLDFFSLERKVPVTQLLEEKTRLLMFIFNSKGELVLNPYKSKVRIKYVDSPSIAATDKGKWYLEDTDYIGITLSKDIGPALPIAKSSSLEAVFRPGYPACTGCQEDKDPNKFNSSDHRGKGKNSDGVHLYWNSGETVALETAMQFLNLPDIIRNTYKVNQMIFFTNDTHSGMSGGPILNVKGDVIGITTGVQTKLIHGKKYALSRGVRPPEFEKEK